MNDFLRISELPALAADPYCYSSRAGSLSQVSDIFLVPFWASAPIAFEDLQAWRDAADNEAGIRHLSGQGGVIEPEKFIPTLPRLRPRPVASRLYTLSIDFLDVTAENYQLAELLQRGRADYRLWFATLSGRMVGGKYGIALSHTDANLPLSPEANGVEKITALFYWIADGDAPRGGEQNPGVIGSGNAVARVWGEEIEEEVIVWGEDENNVWAFN